MSIGSKIREARKAAKLTQVELAEKTRLSRSYIGDIEKDRYNPSLSTLKLIAKATNMSLSTLLHKAGDDSISTTHNNSLFPLRLKYLREKADITQAELAQKLDVTQQAVGRWERGQTSPDYETLKKLSVLFDVSVDYLLDNQPPQKDSLPVLTPKDERQIAKDLENIVDTLNGAAAMSDDPEDEEDREMLKAALLQAMTLSKRIAKKKFTPKKYRREG